VNARENPQPEPAEPSAAATDSVQPPWWRAPKATGRRRQPLSREAIVGAAVRILDREGVDALTVRRLGEELGTGSATLYWHVASKDELVELVYDHVVGEVVLPDLDTSRWQQQLQDVAWQIYRIMLRHNDLARLSIGRVPVGPKMLRVIEWNLDLLRGAGVPDRAAAYFGDIFGRYLDASVLEITARGGPPIEQITSYFAGLPVEQFPNIAALTETMFTADDDERFQFGLDLLIAGLEAQIVPKKRPQSRRR
jgi:AcrR family transcriptional regulator